MKNTLNLLLENTQKSFEKKDYSLALGQLYKASKLTGNTPEVKKLLSQIQLSLIKQEQIPQHFTFPQLHSPWNVMPSLLISLMLIFLLKALSFFYNNVKPGTIYIVSSIAFMSFFFYASYKQHNFYFKPQAMSLKVHLSAHLAPDQNSPITNTFKHLHLMKIKKIKNNWALVQVKGQVGWVPIKSLFFTSFQSLDILWSL